jgi:glycosyltransferase involved in cell wall biosynthesis
MEQGVLAGRLRAPAGEAASAPVLSVVVPVRDGGSGFARCLDALAASTFRAWELIVVDDGSTDRSAAIARAAGARVLATGRPRSGPARARNLGAAAAHGDVLFFVDADVAVRPDTLDRVVAVFRREPAVAAMFGSYDTQPPAPNVVSQYKNLFHHFVHQTSRAEASTFWSGCGAVRRAVFLDLGGFDTSYARPAIEDIELGYRLTRAGHTIRLCHDLQVTHLKRWTLWSLLRTDIRDRGIPWTALLLRERLLMDDLNLRLSDRASVIATILLGVALLATVVTWSAALVAALLALLLLALNAPLYRFFWSARGGHFALAAIPLHWLYFAYSGLCVILGTLAYLRAERVTPASLPLEIIGE